MISDWVVKLAGIVLVICGLGLILAAIGVNLIGVHVPLPWWGEGIVGLLVLGCGVIVIRGGAPSL